MALPDFFKNAQSQVGIQVAPVSFTYLEVGGYGDSAAPGRWFPFLADVDGNLFVTLGGAGGGPIAIPDNADAVAEVATDTRIPTVARLYGYDETASAFDRIRTDEDNVEASDADGDPALKVMGRNRLYNNNDDAWQRQKGQGTDTIAASAARSVTTTFGNFLNTNWRAWHVIVDVTVIGVDTLTIDIEARDVVTLAFYPILTSLAISAVGTTVLKIGQGFTPVPNLTANDMIPYITRVVATHSGADPITYSIASNYGV